MRWTPDGQAILFIAADYTGPHPEGGWRLRSISAFGGAAVLVGLDSLGLATPPGVPALDANNVSSLDISPDGTRVIFSSAPFVSYSLLAVENLVACVRR